MSQCPKPCKGCGGPKGLGVARRYCDSCRAKRHACVVCGEPALPDRRTCSGDCLAESRAAAAYHAITTRRLNATPRPPSTERTCSRCDETWPLTMEFFGPERRDLETGEILKFNRWCRVCKAADQRDRHARRTPEQRERDREYNRAAYELRRLSPEQRELDRRRKVEWQRRNPEKVAAASRRYRNRLMADPERYALRLENDRIAYRLGVLDGGREPALRPAVNGYKLSVGRTPDALAVEPMAVWVAALIAREVPDRGRPHGDELASRDDRSRTIGDLCAELGIEDRVLYRIEHMSYRTVTLGLADRMLTRYGRPLFIDGASGESVAARLAERCLAMPGNGERVLRYIDLAERIGQLDGVVVDRVEDLWPGLTT